MSKRLQFKLTFDEDLAKYIGTKHPKAIDYRIISKSLDARGAPRGKRPVFHYIVEIIEAGQTYEKQTIDIEKLDKSIPKPIIIGAGPAGLFCALRFAEYGIPCEIVERGDEARNRMLHISKYWRYGQLNTESNVCFGEGGAGLFSDGKLITRIKSPYVQYVMDQFVKFGAPEDTAYLSNPHLGSNKIRKLINLISAHLKEAGCVFHYNTRVDDIIVEDKKVTGVELSNGEKLYSDYTILAAGHSAKQMYYKMLNHNVTIKPKDFAVGVRVEHPRELVDKIQHGCYWEQRELGSARYKLSHHNHESNKGSYSFCMCPGGYVLSSGTEKDGIVVNGMSNYARNSRWSNSALVVSINSGKDFDEANPLGGLEFCEEIERAAYDASIKDSDGKSLPAMTVKEFIDGKIDSKITLPTTSSPSKLFKTDIRKIFPQFINDHLKESILTFEKKMPGFISDQAVLIAPETRTSAPVTIIRDKETLCSVSHDNFYPCGEGAGYAGGITSAAVDGINVCEAIVSSLKT